MTAEEPQTAPVIESLKLAMKNDAGGALAAFWPRVEREGTPIVEPCEDEPEKSWTTFLWREREPVKNVAVIGQVFDFDPNGKVMERIKGTDVLYKSYLFRSDLRTCYELAPNDPLTPVVFDETFEERTATWQLDPLNTRRYRVNVKDDEDPTSKEKYLSVLELPQAPPQPWAQPKPGGLAGKVEFRRVRNRAMGDERRVWVYTPPQTARQAEPAALLVLTDAIPYTQIVAAPTTLDDLILAGKIPPTVAAFVDNPQRFTDLNCNPDFARFLAEELVPQLREEFRLTPGPARTVIGGTSLGGLFAGFVGLRHSNVFGCVLSQSGAFLLSPNGDPEDEWLTRQFVDADTSPLSFYIDVGLHELGGQDGPGRPSMLTANRHMRDVLRARGYPVTYLEFNGAHNYICWQGTLADALIALIGQGPGAEV